MIERTMDDRYTKRQLETFAQVDDVVKHLSGMSITELGRKGRKRMYVLIRTFYCYYVRKAGMSLWDMADKCRFSSHGTAYFHAHRHEDRMKYDELYRVVHSCAVKYCNERNYNWIE